MHRAKGDRLVRASGLPVRQCTQRDIYDTAGELCASKYDVTKQQIIFLPNDGKTHSFCLFIT